MDRAQRMFIDRLGDAAEADGLSPIAGRLFALLMLAAEPQSLDELAEALGVSKASVSTDARRLLDRGIVERTRRTGDRRDFYELAPDFFARVIRARVARWRRIQQLVDDVRVDSTALCQPRRRSDSTPSTPCSPRSSTASTKRSPSGSAKRRSAARPCAPSGRARSDPHDGDVFRTSLRRSGETRRATRTAGSPSPIRATRTSTSSRSPSCSRR